ncbi:MAG: AAA family ATPase [Deltaproteobacteria bacterium]
MLKSIAIKNLTVFSEASLHFSPQLNVVVGENGVGKSHLLKALYAVLAASAEEGRKPGAPPPAKNLLKTRLADKLVAVLRPESLGRLARRKKGAAKGNGRCEMRFVFDEPKLNIDLSFAARSASEVGIDKLPDLWMEKLPVFLPTRELLTIYPGFISIYESHYLEIEETWRDICLLLGAPPLRGPREERVNELLSPLEDAMGGEIELDKNGRFYLKVPGEVRMEITMVAEGLAKLAMLARLIATGALMDKTCLFWDEPEANLNPKLIKDIARSIVQFSKSGIQVFIATHSLFIMRELDILLHTAPFKDVRARFFGLLPGADGVTIEQGDNVDDIGKIAALDEELSQSDRYLDRG